MTGSKENELSSPVGQGQEAPLSKKTRTRSGCLNCRRRRRKCDEIHPECSGCRQRGEVCDWGMKITFRSSNRTEIDADHPSMQQGSRKRARSFKIVDVTSQIEKGYTPSSVADSDSQSINTSVTPSSLRDYEQTSPRSTVGIRSQILDDGHASRKHPPPPSQSNSPIFTPNSTTTSYHGSHSFVKVADENTTADPSPGSGSVQDSRHAGHTYHEGNISCSSPMDEQILDSRHDSPSSRVNTADAAADLLALRYMPVQPSIYANSMTRTMVPPAVEHASMLCGNDLHPTDILDEQRDGIFLPGSAYQEFHSTLRDHLIYTARSNGPTRHGTPDLPQLDTDNIDRLVLKVNGSESDPEYTRPSRSSEITPQREYILWKVWIDEVAPWLDKFDNNRHFEHKLPMIARTIPHLKSSILAVSARQVEMKYKSKSSSESLALYQEAIHLLLPDLHSKGIAVIASCVILCVLEMMSCSPIQWRRHLEGCANLLRAVEINGFSGGVEEALFWCFARMDLCGALISQDVTLIPVERWTSTKDFASSIKLFRNPASGFDTCANYAVFLCANCVTYIEGRRRQSREEESKRWTELMDLLDKWYLERPLEMLPILTIPAVAGEDSSPFPTLLYGNGPGVSGNQLYHTATLLMLQEKPAGLQAQRKQKSIFWHARQICAISESNSHHGAWTNSIQPIWIAGKVMSNPNEHRAILNILERIERELGWATSTVKFFISPLKYRS